MKNVFVLALLLVSTPPDSNPAGTPVPHRLSGIPSEAPLNINRITAWYQSNGLQEDHRIGRGLVYPHGTASTVFSAGLVWGGSFYDALDPVIRVEGQSYRSGTKPGAILGIRTGVSEDPDDAGVRIWRIRRDYRTADLRRDAAEINDVDPEEVSHSMIEDVRSQYETDWNEWPWEKGAPYYDLNGNQVMDSDDEPGLAGADQVLWLVCNDLDTDPLWSVTESGMELQLTVWGYNQDGPLGNIIYKRARFIYKGTEQAADTATIEDFYISNFTDGDLGLFADDAAGCDTTMSLGFFFNATAEDPQYAEYGLTPPSLGYRIVDSPVVPGAGERVHTPMTAFMFHATGDAYSDPPFVPGGALQWHCLMQGFPPTPQPPPCPLPPFDPFTGQRLTGTYWVYGASDGISYPDATNPDGWVDPSPWAGPGDRRFVQSTGPFSLALGDTIDVTYAIVGGLGESHLNSVEIMKANAHVAQDIYDGLQNLPAPQLTVVTTLTAGSSTLRIEADAQASTPSSVSVAIKRPDESVVATEQLYDDGTHGDSTAGDFIFTSVVTVARNADPYHLDASVEYVNGTGFTWENTYSPIVTVGSFTIDDLRIFSDNINADGEANPGENIRFGFDLSYSGILPLVDVDLSTAPETEYKVLNFGFIPVGFSDSMLYDPGNPESFFSTDIPEDFTETDFRIVVGITDARENIWRDTLLLPVTPFPAPPGVAGIEHTHGSAPGSFGIVVFDSAAVRNHTYVIEGINEPGGFLGFHLRDSTDGRLLLERHPFPDQFAHNVPVTDGFKVMRGTIVPEGGWDTAYVSAGTSVWTSVFANGLGLEGFNGAMGSGWSTWFGGSSLPSSRASRVIIRFAATDNEGNPVDPADTLVSFAYRYMQNADQPPAQPDFAQYILNPDTGFAYQGFAASVPFAAFESAGNRERRLAVGHLENNVISGRVDGRYWPGYPGSGTNNTAEIGPREWFFLFDSTYTETMDPLFETDLRTPLPLMWWGTPHRPSDLAFSTGNEFTIDPFIAYHSDDRWTFNPTIIVDVPNDNLPFSYSLSQNYPNPFNPATTIRYSIPRPSIVTIRIYNLLGQEVRMLVNEAQSAGDREVLWDGTNNNGTTVSTGVYFYRLDTPDIERGTRLVRKMLLIR